MRLSKRDQLAIGHEVQIARDIYNTPWKELSRVYGLGRTRLYQLYQLVKTDHKNVHEHMGYRQNRAG